MKSRHKLCPSFAVRPAGCIRLELEKDYESSARSSPVMIGQSIPYTNWGMEAPRATRHPRLALAGLLPCAARLG